MSDPSLFSTHDAFIQRVLVISAASLSIFSGLAVLIWWFVVPWWSNYRAEQLMRSLEHTLPTAGQPNIQLPIKRKRIRQFRHDLTIALIIMDLLKAIVLITYPIRFLHQDHISSVEVYNIFCDVVGFLTVATMQASDFAVLALAIHTALLIFKPGFTGGLYRYRYYIYSIFFVILPLAFASIGMVGNSGYTFFSSWCYLVVQPIWYSLILSWIPRLLIMVLIILIYCSIFIYVKVHLYNVSKVIVQAASPTDHNSADALYVHELAILGIRRVIRLPKQAYRKMWRNTKILLSYLPGLSSINPLLESNNNPKGMIHDSAPIGSTDSQSVHEDFQAQINRENIERFNHRRSIIERQVNSIFIYPLTYVLLYIFPLIQQCLYYTKNHDSSVSDNVEPLFWLAIVASWMKPFNCFVDTCVFVIREGAIPCLSPRHGMQNQFDQRSGYTIQTPRFAEGRTPNGPPTPPPVVTRPPNPRGISSITEDDVYYVGADAEIDYIISNNHESHVQSTYGDGDGHFPTFYDNNRTGPDVFRRHDPLFEHAQSLPWFQRTYHMMMNVLVMEPAHSIHGLLHPQEPTAHELVHIHSLPRNPPRELTPPFPLSHDAFTSQPGSPHTPVPERDFAESADNSHTQNASMELPSTPQAKHSLDWSNVLTPKHEIADENNGSDKSHNAGIHNKHKSSTSPTQGDNNAHTPKVAMPKHAATFSPGENQYMHQHRRVSSFQHMLSSIRHPANRDSFVLNSYNPAGTSTNQFKTAKARAASNNDKNTDTPNDRNDLDDHDENDAEPMGLKEFLAMF